MTETKGLWPCVDDPLFPRDIVQVNEKSDLGIMGPPSYSPSTCRDWFTLPFQYIGSQPQGTSPEMSTAFRVAIHWVIRDVFLPDHGFLEAPTYVPRGISRNAQGVV